MPACPAAGPTLTTATDATSAVICEPFVHAGGPRETVAHQRANAAPDARRGDDGPLARSGSDTVSDDAAKGLP